MISTTGEFKQIHISNNLGWECPKCHNVYAPTITECYYCNKSAEHHRNIVSNLEKIFEEDKNDT